VPPPSVPAAFVFDLGGVLVPFRPAALEPVLRPDVDDAAWWRFVLASPAYRGFETGTVSAEALGAAALAELGCPGVGVAELLAALGRGADTAAPGAAACVARARAFGVPVVLLSNTNPLHWGLLGPQLAASFDHLVLSYRSGHLKPEPGAFAAAEAAVGLAPAGLCFFDDNPHNVAAAAARGWQAHRVTGPADIEAVLDGWG